MNTCSYLFKASTPIESWTSVVTATDDAPGCIQTDVIRCTITLTGESEECLSLNVYTPQLVSNIGKLFVVYDILTFITYI